MNTTRQLGLAMPMHQPSLHDVPSAVAHAKKKKTLVAHWFLKGAYPCKEKIFESAFASFVAGSSMGFFAVFKGIERRCEAKKKGRRKGVAKVHVLRSHKEKEREDTLEAYVRGIADWHGGACYVLLFSSEKRRILSVREALLVLVFPVSYL